MWYDQLAKLRENDDVQIVGLIQEQHADRCALFLQWKQMNFPVLVDSLNRTGVSAVPLLWAIDESGVIRKTRPDLKWFRETFVTTDYPAIDVHNVAANEESAPSTNVGRFLRRDWTLAINGWQTVLNEDTANAAAWFRWACANRARYDHGAGDPEDFQNAVKGWSKALQLAPNNYIYRRRVQQYGPKMVKPYPFYSWIEQARKDIRKRGEEPVPLVAEPRGAELAMPAQSFITQENAFKEPDPKNQITQDRSLVHARTVVSPYPPVAGKSIRVSLLLMPDKEQEVHWTNDAGTVTLVVDAGETRIDKTIQQWTAVPDADMSEEVRQFDFEVLVPTSADSVDLNAYVVYYVCSGKDGACVYRRQDVKITIPQ